MLLNQYYLIFCICSPLYRLLYPYTHIPLAADMSSCLPSPACICFSWQRGSQRWLHIVLGVSFVYCVWVSQLRNYTFEDGIKDGVLYTGTVIWQRLFFWTFLGGIFYFLTDFAAARLGFFTNLAGPPGGTITICNAISCNIEQLIIKFCMQANTWLSASIFKINELLLIAWLLGRCLTRLPSLPVLLAHNSARDCRAVSIGTTSNWSITEWWKSKRILNKINHFGSGYLLE